MTSVTIPKNILDRLQLASGCRAILLAGSHGRGEGDSPTTGVLPNDLDLVLVIDRPLSLWQRIQLRGLRQTLPARLGVWHVDLMTLTIDELRSSTVRMLIYDLKFGSVVLAGDATVCDLIPYTESTPIPPKEIENLLINRLVTLAEGEPSGRTSRPQLLRAARQVCKCLYAIGDACLVHQGTYHTLYAKKRERIIEIADRDPRAQAIRALLPWMERAWSYQLSEAELTPSALLPIWNSTREMLIRVLLDARGTVDNREYPTVTAAAETWRNRAAEHRSVLQALLGILDQRPLKRVVEIGLAEWAAAAHTDPDAQRSARDRLVSDWYRAR